MTCLEVRNEYNALRRTRGRLEVLDAIREVLNRLATLEEKTGWHNQVMTDLGRGQKELVLTYQYLNTP